MHNHNVIIHTKVFMKTHSIIFDTPRPSLDLTDFFCFVLFFFVFFYSFENISPEIRLVCFKGTVHQKFQIQSSSPPASLSWALFFHVTTRLDKVNVSCSLSYSRCHSYSSTDVYPDYRRVQRGRSLKLYCLLKAQTDVSESELTLDIVFSFFYIYIHIFGGGGFVALLW